MKALEALLRELEAAGLKPGTPAFDRELRARKVQLCKDARAVSSCWDCAYFDHCELIKNHLRDLYHVPPTEEGNTSGSPPPTRTGK